MRTKLKRMLSLFLAVVTLFAGLGIQNIDINPIKEGKSGTLQTYLPKAEQYLAKKQETQEKPKRISIKEKLKGKQAEVNKNAANKHKSVAHGKNNIDL